MGKKDKAKERSNGQNKWLRYCLRGVLIFVLVALCISGFSIYREYSRPPEEVIIRALEQTLASPSYLFHSESSRTIDGQTEKLCEVWGEKNEESTHLVGTVDVVDSKFEIYQIKNQFYRQDAISKEWLVINEVSEEATEKLLQEIDPLAVFRFDQNIWAKRRSAAPTAANTTSWLIAKTRISIWIGTISSTPSGWIRTVICGRLRSLQRIKTMTIKSWR